MKRFAILRLASLALFVAAPANVAIAQTDAVMLSGKVTKVQGGTIYFTAPPGDYLLQVNGNNALAVLTGSVDKSALRAGLSVRFDTVLDDKNQAKGEVKAVTVFTPSKTFGYRIDLPKNESGKRTVAGKISKIGDEGLVTLNIPGEKKVQFTVDKDATVTLEMRLSEPLAFKLLKPGDNLLILGTGTAPKGKTPGRVKLDSAFVRREAAAPKDGEEEPPTKTPKD